MSTVSLEAGIGMGRRQWAVLERLAACFPDGRSTPELAELGAQSSLRTALHGLECRGLAILTGTAPAVSADGRGARSHVWTATEAGRELWLRDTA